MSSTFWRTWGYCYGLICQNSNSLSNFYLMNLSSIYGKLLLSLKYEIKSLNVSGSQSMKYLPSTFFNSCLPENIASSALPLFWQNNDLLTLVPIVPPISNSIISSSMWLTLCIFFFSFSHSNFSFLISKVSFFFYYMSDYEY